MGMNAGAHHLTAFFLSRQLQPNNLPVCKLYQVVTMQPMWSNPNIHTSLSNTIRLQKVGRQSCRWNAGNYVVHTISLLYFKQADTTKQPTAIQTVTMQPMWCNPNINTYLFNSTGLHEGWKKFTQLEYGNECRCAPSHSFIFKQAVTTKQPASMQIVSNCDNATHVVQPKHTH